MKLFVSWVHGECYPFKPFCLLFNVSGSGFLAFVCIYIYHITLVSTKFRSFFITELMKRAKNT